MIQATVPAQNLVIEQVESRQWALIERLSYPTPHQKREFPPSQRYADREISDILGDEIGNPGVLLLHYPHDYRMLKGTPALLVWGSGSDANRYYHHGIGAAFRRAGVPAYSITFGRREDSIESSALSIQWGINRIKEVHGCDKVTVFGHSLGGIKILYYLTSGKDTAPVCYQKDVSTAIFSGVPFGGIDLLHRNPRLNVKVLGDLNSQENNIPLTWSQITRRGTTQNLKRYSFDCYPALRSILADWTRYYPLVPNRLTCAGSEQELRTTYHGGKCAVHSFEFEALGIHREIEREPGGNLLKRISQRPVPTDVEIHVIAGTSPTTEVNYGKGGRGDGYVLFEAALGFGYHMCGGGRVTEKDFPLNHFEIILDKSAIEYAASTAGTRVVSFRACV